MKTFAACSGRGLYAITDGPRADLLEVVALALAGGARLLQYRDKSADAARRHSEATALRQLCHAHGVPLIINDDVALAQAVAADGVHLGKNDDDLGAARSVLGGHAIIGVSCYDSLPRAQAAVRAGASYIAFGAFFPSPTKPLAPRASIDLLRQSAALGVPRVAIGGITPDNGALLVAAGADYLAAISAVFSTADVRAAAQCFADMYSSDREQSH
ncbi:MAG TPA: thiamine phosphate synthase [Rhodanobacter sp.]|nr:thiamine phosphate synthase [Rhodanobacter sp.]